jgi:hypothetical protein
MRNSGDSIIEADVSMDRGTKAKIKKNQKLIFKVVILVMTLFFLMLLGKAQRGLFSKPSLNEIRRI